MVLERRPHGRRTNDEVAMRSFTTGWILVTTLGIAMAPHAVLAQSLTNQQLLERIELLETQLSELKSLVRAQPGVQAPGAEAPKSEPVKTDASPSLDYLRDLKFGSSLDTYYGFNFNRPVGRVNLLRAYDVMSNNFSLNQASVVLESVANADAGRRFGGRVDLQYGQATETLQGNPANEPRPWVYRNIFQAFGTYVFPLGSGLTVDFGKWASSLGLETNYVKDQWNYSRSYWFDYLPFYHMGARVGYGFNDALAVNYWLTNGTQQAEEFNNFKDQLVEAVINPTKSVTWTTNFYIGQEQADVERILAPGVPSLPTQPGMSVVPIVSVPDGKLHIFDTYATWQATENTAFSLEADYVVSRLWNEPGAGRSTVPSRVYGGAVYARRQVTPKVALAARGEYLRDDGGLFSGVTQSLKETTLTYEYKASDGFLMRAEWRRDFSNLPFFLTRNAGVIKANQDTATIGMIWWWGNKRGTW
jgi:Putative beta-barrel porin-2, OmpL-like. bbp2